MICLSQCLAVLKYQPLDAAQVVRSHSSVAGQTNHWIKPELTLALGRSDMNMWWFVALIGIKMKPE